VKEKENRRFPAGGALLEEVKFDLKRRRNI
jgi:hypothetical protein